MRLQRFYSAWFIECVHPGFLPAVAGTDLMDGLRDPDLRDSAELVLHGFQEDLLRLESPVEPHIAKPLMRERLWAITALSDLGGHKRAKETVLDLTDGAPLTICMGDVCRIRGSRWKKKTVLTTVGEMGFTVHGCRAIFPDAVHTHGGEMWPGWCKGCGSARRKPHRDQGRAVARRLNAVKQGKGATIYEWSVTVPEDALPPRGTAE